MIRTHRRARVLVAAVSALAVSGIALAGTAAAQGSGEVSVSGSSTVEPITSLVAELYAEKNPDVSVRVDGPGTGDGFKLFCTGDIDIADASRAIKDEEGEAPTCEANGITYAELPVGPRRAHRHRQQGQQPRAEVPQPGRPLRDLRSGEHR